MRDPIELMLGMYKKTTFDSSHTPPSSTPSTSTKDLKTEKKRKIDLYKSETFSPIEALLTIEGRKRAQEMFAKLSVLYYDSSSASYTSEWEFLTRAFYGYSKKVLNDLTLVFQFDKNKSIKMNVLSHFHQSSHHVFLVDHDYNILQQGEVIAHVLTKNQLLIRWKEKDHTILIQCSKEDYVIEELKCEYFEALWTKSKTQQEVLGGLSSMFKKYLQASDTELDLHANWYTTQSWLKIKFETSLPRALPCGVVSFNGKNVMKFECDEKTIKENTSKITKQDMQDWIVFNYMRDFIASSIQKLNDLMKNKKKYRIAPGWEASYKRVVVWANEEKNHFFVGDWQDDPAKENEKSFDSLSTMPPGSSTRWKAYRGEVITIRTFDHIFEALQEIFNPEHHGESFYWLCFKGDTLDLFQEVFKTGESCMLCSNIFRLAIISRDQTVYADQDWPNPLPLGIRGAIFYFEQKKKITCFGQIKDMKDTWVITEFVNPKDILYVLQGSHLYSVGKEFRWGDEMYLVCFGDDLGWWRDDLLLYSQKPLKEVETKKQEVRVVNIPELDKIDPSHVIDISKQIASMRRVSEILPSLYSSVEFQNGKINARTLGDAIYELDPNPLDLNPLSKETSSPKPKEIKKTDKKSKVSPTILDFKKIDKKDRRRRNYLVTGTYDPGHPGQFVPALEIVESEWVNDQKTWNSSSTDKINYPPRIFFSPANARYQLSKRKDYPRIGFSVEARLNIVRKLLHVIQTRRLDFRDFELVVDDWEARETTFQDHHLVYEKISKKYQIPIKQMIYLPGLDLYNNCCKINGWTHENMTIKVVPRKLGSQESFVNFDENYDINRDGSRLSLISSTKIISGELNCKEVAILQRYNYFEILHECIPNSSFVSVPDQGKIANYFKSFQETILYYRHIFSYTTYLLPEKYRVSDDCRVLVNYAKIQPNTLPHEVLTRILGENYLTLREEDILKTVNGLELDKTKNIKDDEQLTGLKKVLVHKHVRDEYTRYVIYFMDLVQRLKDFDIFDIFTFLKATSTDVTTVYQAVEKGIKDIKAKENIELSTKYSLILEILQPSFGPVYQTYQVIMQGRELEEQKKKDSQLVTKSESSKFGNVPCKDCTKGQWEEFIKKSNGYKEWLDFFEEYKTKAFEFLKRPQSLEKLMLETMKKEVFYMLYAETAKLLRKIKQVYDWIFENPSYLFISGICSIGAACHIVTSSLFDVLIFNVKYPVTQILKTHRIELSEAYENEHESKDNVNPYALEIINHNDYFLYKILTNLRIRHDSLEGDLSFNQTLQNFLTFWANNQKFIKDQNTFEFLGIQDSNVTYQNLQRACKRKALSVHPDKNIEFAAKVNSLKEMKNQLDQKFKDEPDKVEEKITEINRQLDELQAPYLILNAIVDFFKSEDNFNLYKKHLENATPKKKLK